MKHHNRLTPNQKNIKELDFKLGGELAEVFMSSVVEILKQNGGENFLTLTLADQDNNKYGVTIQNCNGSLTPHEKILELEAENNRLRQLRKKDQQTVTELYKRVKSIESKSQAMEVAISNLAFIEDELDSLDQQREGLAMLKEVTLAEAVLAIHGNEEKADKPFAGTGSGNFGFSCPPEGLENVAPSLAEVLQIMEDMGFSLPIEILKKD